MCAQQVVLFEFYDRAIGFQVRAVLLKRQLPERYVDLAVASRPRSVKFLFAHSA